MLLIDKGSQPLSPSVKVVCKMLLTLNVRFCEEGFPTLRYLDKISVDKLSGLQLTSVAVSTPGEQKIR